MSNQAEILKQTERLVEARKMAFTVHEMANNADLIVQAIKDEIQRLKAKP
jgi:hypothetical protein